MQAMGGYRKVGFTSHLALWDTGSSSPRGLRVSSELAQSLPEGGEGQMALLHPQPSSFSFSYPRQCVWVTSNAGSRKLLGLPRAILDTLLGVLEY